MTVKRIRTEQGYAKALARIDSLMNRTEADTPERDELEVLVVLVRDYEEKRFPLAPSEPRDVVRFMLDQRGMTQKDLAEIMGSRSRASEFLSGKINLSRPMIEKVSKALKVRRDLLMADGIAASKVAEKRVRYDLTKSHPES